MRELGAFPEANTAGANRDLDPLQNVRQIRGVQQTLAEAVSNFHQDGYSEAGGHDSKSSWEGGGESHTDPGASREASEPSQPVHAEAAGADSPQMLHSESAHDESSSPGAPGSSIESARTPSATAKGKTRAVGEDSPLAMLTPTPDTKAVRRDMAIATVAPLLSPNALVACSTQGKAIDVVVSTEGSAAPLGRSRVKKYANITWVISPRPCKGCSDVGQHCYRSHLDAHRTYNCRRCHLGKRRCERPDVPDSIKANEAPGKSPSGAAMAPQTAEGPQWPEVIYDDASQPTRGSSRTRRPSQVVPIVALPSRKRGAEAGAGKAESSKKLKGENEPVEHWTVPEVLENVGRQLNMVGYDLMQLGDTLRKASKSLESHSRNANFKE